MLSPYKADHHIHWLVWNNIEKVGLDTDTAREAWGINIITEWRAVSSQPIIRIIGLHDKSKWSYEMMMCWFFGYLYYA